MSLNLFSTPLLGAFSASRALGLAIWIGMGVLTLALLIIMRTRWGQTQPLSKCVVLSVFAHLLLLAYASGTRLVFDVPASRDERVIRLAMATPGDSRAVEPREPRPWEQPAAELNLVPDLVKPQPRAAVIEAPPLETPQHQPQFDVAATDLPDADAAPKPRLPDPGPSTEPATRQPAPVAVLPDPPGPAESSDPEPLVPVAATLERLAMDRATAPAVNHNLSDELVNELLQDSLLQQLTDPPLPTDIADAVPASIDLTRASTNRQEVDEPAAPPDSAGEMSASPAAVRRLGDGQPLPPAYQARMNRRNMSLIERNGGNARTERAVEAALRWLAANQEADGRWNASRFGAGQEHRVLGHDRQGAGADADSGITGLALLAFLAAGHTHFEGEYRRTVQHGLEFLLSQQAADGSLSGNTSLFARMYCHGIATLAACEAYGMTGDHRLQPYVERAVQYTIRSQHPATGGWRYQPLDEGDTSQFGWQVMALESAELAGLPIPGEARAGMLRFLRRVSKGEHGGLAAYRPTERPSNTMTAEALTCRILLGVPREPRVFAEAASSLLRELPGQGQDNLYYWYYATFALFQLQDDRWQTWNEHLQPRLLSTQRSEGALSGSWDPDPVWGGYGGRVYSTALAALCLEVYYRYLPISQ